MSSKHLKHPFTKLENGQVKRPATQVIYRHLFSFRRALQPACQRRGCRFIDDSLDLPAGLLSRQLGGLTLRIIEISRHGNDRSVHRLTQRLFRLDPKCFQDQC